MPYGFVPSFEKALFGKKPAKPTPVTLPDEQDPAAIEARRTRQAQLLASTGRSSTNLSNPSTAVAPNAGDYGRQGL